MMVEEENVSVVTNLYKNKLNLLFIILRSNINRASSK